MAKDIVVFITVSSLVFYVASLGLPCFDPEDDPGIALLLFGPLGLIAGEFAWLANPCYFFAILSLMATYSRGIQSTSPAKLAVLSAILASLGVLLALLFAFQESTYYGNHSVGLKSEIRKLLIGYWFWLTSMTLLVVAALARCLVLWRNPPFSTDRRFIPLHP